jgi:hypothetical protein
MFRNVALMPELRECCVCGCIRPKIAIGCANCGAGDAGGFYFFLVTSDTPVCCYTFVRTSSGAGAAGPRHAGFCKGVKVHLNERTFISGASCPPLLSGEGRHTEAAAKPGAPVPPEDLTLWLIKYAGGLVPEGKRCDLAILISEHFNVMRR